MTYDGCLKEMYALKRFGIKLGLDLIGSVLAMLGNPHKNYKCIHIAGTNGKGSIASAIATILACSGYKTGLYTSPHLVKFNERIAIDNSHISDENTVSAYKAVKKACKADREPTFFEFATAMALYEFGRQNVDWAVIETGMGGRLDATNIITPVLSVISNISIEHKAYLGDSIAEIAGEKGGIIKEKTPVIVGAKQKSALSVLKKIAGEKEAPFYLYGKDFCIRKDKTGAFTYFGIDNVWRDMKTSLIGSYQSDNAAITLGVCEILNKKDGDISVENIREGLVKNRWQGRLEIVSHFPTVILDGAHNLAAMKNLARFLATSDYTKKKKITLVIGILDDKPYSAMLKALLPLCDRVRSCPN